MVPDSIAVLLGLLAIALGFYARFLYAEWRFAEWRIEQVLAFDAFIERERRDSLKYECYPHLQRDSQSAAPYDYEKDGL